MKSPYEECRKWFRRELLAAIRADKNYHWKRRNTHRLGKHFERGFFRGLNQADAIVRAIMNPHGRLGKSWRDFRIARDIEIPQDKHFKEGRNV